MSLRTCLVTTLLFSALLPGIAQTLAQTDDCPDAPASILEDYGIAVGSPQPLHAEPNAESPLVAEVPVDGIVNVLWPTECVDGARWRKLVYDGAVGFAPDFVDDVPAFEPYTPPDPVDVSIPGRQVTEIASDPLTGEHSSALSNGFWMQPRPGYTYPDAIGPYPNYVRYTIPDYYLVPDRRDDVYIALYPIDEWRQIGTHSGELIDRLQTQLDTRPPLPLLNEDGERAPLVDPTHRGSAQLVRASQKYIDFENGSGIRFIGYYAQMTGELQNSFIYSFNGITDDGQTYVTATFPILLPNGTLPPFDHVANLAAGEEPMNSYYVQYLAEVTAAIEALEPYQTSPSLQTLDNLIASLHVGDLN